MKNIPRKERKPIQITGVGNDIYALCDDGTIWYMGANNDWVKMVQIPKTDVDKDENNN